MKVLIRHIIEQLKEIQEGKPWIGNTYKSKLDGIDSALVFERPHPDLHSIADIISHMNLWRREAILKIETGKGSKTDACEENWLPENKLKAIGWTALKSEYDETLKRIILLLEEKEDSFLEEEYYDTDFKGNYQYKFLINGMLHHDIYHLGQLGTIIKRLKSTASNA
ncbi:MAG: hypothetical protein CMB99_12595 [Flavobacteriaceae bacterium]|nr:hypothetical protein [Flavobacteriaceae bacterium]|tara:strand:- start:14289 stop:14789 length:501 start_codon:yes stop_codon:yes gene_type:complete